MELARTYVELLHRCIVVPVTVMKCIFNAIYRTLFICMFNELRWGVVVRYV